jgi:hypothetical protein
MHRPPVISIKLQPLYIWHVLCQIICSWTLDPSVAIVSRDPPEGVSNIHGMFYGHPHDKVCYLQQYLTNNETHSKPAHPPLEWRQSKAAGINELNPTLGTLLDV